MWKAWPTKRWGALALTAALTLAAAAQHPTGNLTAPAAERAQSYLPDGRDIVCVNGNHRYTRALYSNHSFFRVETSDRPVFALYQKKKECGNLTFVIRTAHDRFRADSAVWCEARYHAGQRVYTLRDPRLGSGSVRITALPDKERDGALWQLETMGTKGAIGIEARLCECRSQKFARSGDMGWFNSPSDYDAPLQPQHLRTTVVQLRQRGWVAVDGGEQLALSTSAQGQLKNRFARAADAQRRLATWVTVDTPDSYLNALGGNLTAAADGAWDGETWLHGAVGWRAPLPGWRAAYAGDFLGFPDRQRSHFTAYAESQVTDTPPTLPHEQDSANNLARGVYKWGTPLYSNGYICRSPHNNRQFHHYDMNLAFIDELLWHCQFDADTAFLRRMWPVIERHLAWEKATFDPNGDALYDAYCCIWASDALQYSGGAVTHSSAYNYRGNRLAANIARRLNIDGTPYEQEAQRILDAMNKRLWMDGKGVWAEYQDALGLKRLHESPGLWTVYTAIDSRACSPRQAYDATRWIDRNIPHIPYIYNGERFEVLTTTNWMPYEWSINNVAMAENLHTALAYYEAGRAEEATQLLRATVVDLQYAGSSPGNFGQLSALDMNTGECYRDFSDVVGIATRTVVQGLFGITP